MLGSGGDYGYARALLAGSAPAGPGVFTYGLEYLHNDGPWEVPDNFRKYNAVARYVVPIGEGKLGVTGMAYQGKWNSTDQIPQRAVNEGILGRYGTLDDSDGGKSQRYSMSVDYSTPLAGGQFQTTAYWFKYKLNLFSNFTYFLDDPENGDQFEQADDRNVYGWTGSWSRLGEIAGVPTRNTLGFELRQDRIDPVGLYSTLRRDRLSTTREDNVDEGSAGIYAQNDTQWNEWFRSILGLRYDWYRFKVDSFLPENSGNVTSGIASPKASFVFGPWAKTEYLLNAGYGFHSNDARGVAIRIDPRTAEPVDSATPLVRSKGAEIGHADGGNPERAVVARALVSQARQRARVRRRRRHDGGRPAVAALRCRMEQPLAAVAVSLRRPRHRLESRAVHRRRPERQLHSRRAGYRDLGGSPSTNTATGRAAFLRYIGSYP